MSSAQKIIQAAAGASSGLENVSLLINADGLADGSTSFVDESDNGHTVTAYSDAQVDTAIKKYGTGSIKLDGNGAYLDVPFDESFVFGTGDFTVELWAYLNSNVDSRWVAVGKGIDDSPEANQSWGLSYRTAGELRFDRYDNGSYVTNTVSWSPSLSTWYHIAASRSGTDLRFFVDGTQVGSTLSSSTNFDRVVNNDLSGFIDPLIIGRLQGGGGDHFYVDGYIDDLRITKGVALYTANFTAPTEALPTS